MRLGEIATQRSETVSFSTGLGDWRPVTVHLDGRVSARNRNFAFAGQMFAAHPGDIVFSKIDARQGAIGLVPTDFGKAFVTSEFPAFYHDHDRVELGYLRPLLRSKHFVAQLAMRASGTSGRKRVAAKDFEALIIPLPGIGQQRALIAADVNAAIHAEAAVAAAAAVERAAAAAFAAALGLAPPAPLPDRPAFVARFADLDRWSHEAVLRRVSGGEPPPPRWPIVRLGDVIADLQNGWSPQCLDRPAEGEEWGVLKLGAVSRGRFQEQENKALPADLKPREQLQIMAGDVLIVRGSGQTRLVGAAAHVGRIASRLIMPDLMFRVSFRRASIVDPRWLTELLSTPALRHAIEGSRTGAAPMMQKITKPALLALTFPLPPLDTQRALVADLIAARTEAAALRAQAARTRAAAATAFEDAIWV